MIFSAGACRSILSTSSQALRDPEKQLWRINSFFANATPERPALYFTVLGEPALKMLRYQQQYSFFDLSKLNNSIHFINLSQVLTDKGLNGILEEITKEVEAVHPGIVIVDSFRSVVRKAVVDPKGWTVFDQLLDGAAG